MNNRECRNACKGPIPRLLRDNQEITTGNLVLLKTSAWELQLSCFSLKSLVHSERFCPEKGTHLWQNLKMTCFTWFIDTVNFDRPNNNFCGSISVGRLSCTRQHGLHQLRSKSRQDYSTIIVFARGMQWTKQQYPQEQQLPPNTGNGKTCEKMTSTRSNERTIATRPPPPPLCRSKGILLANQQGLQAVGDEGSESCKIVLPVFLDDRPATA